MIDNNGLKKLIVPLILEQLLAVSVGMVDTIMVSTVGEVAVSGVALVDNINRLVIHVLSAFAAGGVVIVGQNIGADDKKGAVKDSKHLLKIAYAGDWICKITLFIIAPVIVSAAVFAALKINLPLCIAPPILVAFSEFMRKDNKARQTPVKTVILIFICACAGAVCRYVLSEKLGSPLAVSAPVSSVLMLVSLHAAKMYLPPAGALAILPMLIPAEELIYYPAQVFLGVGAFMLVAILINRICKCDKAGHKEKV